MSLELDPNNIWRDFVTDGIPATGPHEPRKVDIRSWSFSMWQAVIALLADANPGLALPNLLIRYTITGGTANAISAEPNLTPPVGVGLALFSISISQANTGSVTINGKPLLTNGGEQIAAGEILPGDLLVFLDNGTHFRLIMDTGSLRNKLAAEAAQVIAEQAAADALAIAGSYEDLQEAVDLAETHAQEAGNQVASVIPSVQRFAVGAAVQSVDLGNEELHPAAVRVFIDGVYQFGNTWGLTDGVITPVGGSWPGDGIVENMEVVIDATSAIAFMVPSNGSVTTPKLADGAVTLDKLDPDIELREQRIYQSPTPFGHAGMRVLTGLRNDAHYGFNSGILDAGNGKWVIVYRKASNHTVVNGSEIWAVDTYDQGATLENHRIISTNASYDTRNFVARVMANGRLGIIASRRTAGTLVYVDPVFIYSDDAGETWTTTVFSAPFAGWGVNFHGHMIDFPASVGGDDVEGFIAHSYGHTGGHIDAATTTDNGDTWTWETQVASPPGGISSLTEMACERVGTQNKWIMLVRASGTMDDPGIVYTSTDPLDFGTGVPAGVGLTGNPPQVIYDDETGKFWYTSFARRDRGWGRSNPANGIENVFLVASADGDALFAAGGVMSSLGVNWSIGAYLPDWASGYLHPFKIDGKWFGTLVCGEDYIDHAYSKLCLIGDFVATGVDQANFDWMFQWSAVGTRATYRQGIEVGFGLTPPSERGYVTAGVASSIAGWVSETFTDSSRSHSKFRNTNGVVGSIATSGSATSFNTSSDGQLKPVETRVDLAVEMDIGAVIDALMPVAHGWLDNRGEPVDGRGYGLIAQDVHQIVPSAVTEGNGSPGNPDYQPWSIDYSKLVVFLLAELKSVRARLNALEGGE